MRLAGQAKAGYYPAHPRAIAELAKHLQLAPPLDSKPGYTMQVIDPVPAKGGDPAVGPHARRC